MSRPVEQKEPHTISLIEAFDELSYAVNNIHTASLDNIGERAKLLRVAHRQFRAQFNRYFLRGFPLQRSSSSNE